MRQPLNHFGLAAIGAVLRRATLLAGPAAAGDYNDMASYNHPYGMAAGQETQSITPSLRDANGNLTVVNGQITARP